MHGLRMPSTLAVQLCSGWFLLHILLFLLSVVLDDPFIDALQPQSLTVQVSGSRCCPGREQAPGQSQAVPEQRELGVALYGLRQGGGEGVEGFVDLCVDLDWGCVGVFSWGEECSELLVSCEIYLGRCYSKQSPCLVWFILLLYPRPSASSYLLWSWEMTDTFGMLHLVFKGDRAPPLPRRISVLLQMGGAVDGEVIQQHYVCACRQRKKNPSVKEVPTDTLKCQQEKKIPVIPLK